MLLSQYKRMKKEEKEKPLPLRKISNNFLFNTIEKNNPSTLKIMFYIASVLRDFVLDKLDNEELVEITLNKKDMLSYTMLSDNTIRRSIKSMQETSISFINKEDKFETGISLLPLYESKHSIRMLGLLNKIDSYDIKATNKKTLEQIKKNLELINDEQYKDYVEQENLVRKTKELERQPLPKTISLKLEDINSFFGTNYKKWYDAERKILKVAKDELDNKSPLTFDYHANFENLGKGRPSFSNVKIYPKLQNGVQSRLTSFMK